jgi:hypothetical protein
MGFALLMSFPLRTLFDHNWTIGIDGAYCADFLPSGK